MKEIINPNPNKDLQLVPIQAEEDNEYIYNLKERCGDYMPGWYFKDESEQFSDRYETKEEAVKEFDDYAEWVCGDGPIREVD